MSLLSSLNERQREAVTHFEGPLLVVAGAGSGKTRVITTRVAYLIIERGISPSSILAVTFTNKAADEMRERVLRLLSEHGRAVERPPIVSTFHSFCVRLLRQYGEPLSEVRPGFTTRFGICDATDQLALIKSVMRSLDLSLKDFRARDVQSAISASKNGRGRSASRVRGKDGSTLLAPIMDAYQARLLEMNSLDFDDLLHVAVRLLRYSPAVRHAVRERFAHVLVDEYQDTNRAQYQLMRLIAHPRNNVCVVGDEDQSIYSWRGADINNILGFRGDFPAVTTIRLEQHYRSTRTILEAASAVISKNLNRHEKELWTDRTRGELVRLYEARSAIGEARFVASSVDSLIASDPDARVGIFFRTNAQSRQFEEALKATGVDFVVLGSVGFYQRSEIKDLLAYLRVAASPEDEVSLRRIINVPARGIGKITMGRVGDHATGEGISLWAAIGDLIRRKLLPRRALSALSSFQALITGLKEAMQSSGIEATLTWVAEKSGYMEMLESGRADDTRRLENVRELVVAAKEADGRAESLLAYLDRAALLAAVDRDPGEVRVLLMTLHSAKGLEFPTVFLTGVEEGLIPYSRRGDVLPEEELEEERRLFYVGMTRARDRLTLTWCRNRGRFQGDPQNWCDPSSFLDEIPAGLVSDISRSRATNKPWRLEPRPETERFRPPSNPALNPKNTVQAVKDFFEQSAVPSREPVESAPAAPAVPSGPAAGSAAARSSKLWGGMRRVHSEGRFALGSRVRHRKFGVGVVRRREGRGPGTKLSVYFKDYGLKRLIARAAKLEEL
ncbi:MAG: UvrD-helicase domain-containing protein [Bryobacterales bacterium]|nr:UvrD-helicase domain-containing protein [Bryobacterales bacterium]